VNSEETNDYGSDSVIIFRRIYEDENDHNCPK